MLGSEQALRLRGWRRQLYRHLGTLDIDEILWYRSYRPYFQQLARQVGAQADVLDAGCGYGLWTFHLGRQQPGWQILGVDSDPQRIAATQGMLLARDQPNISFRHLDFAQLEAEQRYDLILALNTLHYYYANDEAILARFYKALKPGGQLFLNVPVSLQLRRYYLHSLKNRHEDAPDDGFHQHYSPEELGSKLNRAQFRLRSLRRHIRAPGTISKELNAAARYPLPRLGVLPLCWLLAQLDDLPLGDGNHLIAMAERPLEDSA